MMTLEEYGLKKEEIDKFNLYIDLLLEWNQKFNLTAITNKDEIVEKHFIDSLLAEKYISFENVSILDVGSGAGFPGIPLAITHPNSKFTLLESNGKKVKFLHEVISKLSLKNVEIIQGRAEETNFIEKYDIVTARAVKQLNILLEICSKMLKICGDFVAYKGIADEEIKQSQNAMKKLNLMLVNDFKYELPSSDKRELVIIRKIDKTPKKYPRLYTEIVKKPL